MLLLVALRETAAHNGDTAESLLPTVEQAVKAPSQAVIVVDKLMSGTTELVERRLMELLSTVEMEIVAVNGVCVVVSSDVN